MICLIDITRVFLSTDSSSAQFHQNQRSVWWWLCREQFLKKVFNHKRSGPTHWIIITLPEHGFYTLRRLATCGRRRTSTRFHSTSMWTEWQSLVWLSPGCTLIKETLLADVYTFIFPLKCMYVNSQSSSLFFFSIFNNGLSQLRL